MSNEAEIPEVVTIDRHNIHAILDEMFESADEHGLYKTTHAMNQFEKLVHDARIEAVGWSYADCCIYLDAGVDPRLVDMSTVLPRLEYDLNKPWLTDGVMDSTAEPVRDMPEMPAVQIIRKGELLEAHEEISRLKKELGKYQAAETEGTNARGV